VLGDAWGKWSGEALTVERLSNTDDFGLYCDAPVENDAEALAFVLSKNLSRRHLSDSQRAMVAAEISSLRQGQRADRVDSPIGDSTAAAMLNVSERSVSRARVVRDHGSPELQEAVKRGALAVSAASEVAAQPVERQAVIIEALTAALKHQIYTDRSGAEHGKLAAETKKALAPLIREIRADKIAAKKERRAEREAETGPQDPGAARQLLRRRDRGFRMASRGLVRSDRERKKPVDALRDRDRRADAGGDRRALRRALRLPRRGLHPVQMGHGAASRDRHQGARAAGLPLRHQLVWNKERPGEARGPGYWFTGEHEIVLVGVRGKVVRAGDRAFPQQLLGAGRRHSEKPDNLHEIIEFHWPTTPKVEFNARRRREGWAAWGFDAPDAAPSPDASARSSSHPAPRATPSGCGSMSRSRGDTPSR
jgi:hypothetical protein